jgi:hypothetical protein
MYQLASFSRIRAHIAASHMQFKGTEISAVWHLSERDERSLTETSASLQGFELLTSVRE